MESQCIAKKAYFDSAPLNLHWEKLAWFYDSMIMTLAMKWLSDFG